MGAVRSAPRATVETAGWPDAGRRATSAGIDPGLREPPVVLLRACRRPTAPRCLTARVGRLAAGLAALVLLGTEALPVILAEDSILPDARADQSARPPQNPDQPAKPVPRDRSIGGDLVGTWNWVSGRSLVVFSDGTFDLYQGSNLIGGGRWEIVDVARRTLLLTHRPGGVVDTVTLSADGRSLDGSDSDRRDIRATKRSIAPEPGTLGVDLVGTWNWVSGRTLIIYADGTFDLYQGSNKINDGRWMVVDLMVRLVRLANRIGGVVDTVTLSADGRTLEGRNSDNQALRGTRRSGPVAAGTIAADLVGTWNWVSARTLVVLADGSFDLYQGGNLIGGGQWSILDAPKRVLRFTYRPRGGVETMTLAADGRSLDGTNGDGARIQGVKR